MLDSIRSEILTAFESSPAFGHVLGKLRGGASRVHLAGLRGSSKSAFCAALVRLTPRPLLVVTASVAEAEAWRDDLTAWLPDEYVHLFHPEEGLLDRRHDPDPEGEGQRILTLWTLSQGALAGVVLCPVNGLLSRVISPESFSAGMLRIRAGDRLDRDQLVERLVDLGYDRVPTVEEVGEVAVRGGIVDVFTFSHAHPFRLEFVGNEVATIRDFEVTTQRSISRKQETLILPASDRLAQASSEFTVVDYLPEGSLVLFDGPEDLEEAGLRIGVDVLQWVDGVPGRSGIRRREDLSVVAEQVARGLSRCQQGIIWAARSSAGTSEVVDLDTRSVEPVGRSLKLLRRRLRELLDEGYRVYVLCGTPGDRNRMEELLLGGSPAALPSVGGFEEESEAPLEGPVVVGIGALHSGFIHPSTNLVVLADQELFQREAPRRPRRFKGGRAIRDVAALKEGDYCVHVDYGIGRYLGLETLSVDGRRYDCLVLAYQGGDRIYVPVEEMKRVETYALEEGKNPTLNKLGTAQWERSKSRVQKAVAEMARELIALYAARKAQRGYAFAPDRPWMNELRTSFPYEETADQLKAEAEVLKDMESERCMERLVCGDVGYGKTEVAVRATFKAVLDSKQVAVLVPTTVLADQHWRTFQERLGTYPVAVEMLSRFRSRVEQKKVLEGLREGCVDIVIGTHRLLQRDVAFRDLGLLVIDEEQRFGVAHKEHLKQLRHQVDVLSLTATPIPRTLYMSLLGVRDMSTIETPPKERLPIVTEVLEWDEEVIRAAILRETDRGGQVYFLHNRVQSIEAVAALLRRLLPRARLEIGHGQLAEGDLARVMHDFYRRKFDILLSTTIIESGLDLPNVNTIIINRADRFGLADLYQLRGRVGRSNRRAYAYFLVPKGRYLTATARKRLATLEELADLGTGFRLALRDLEIRGAGNLLGREQHGHMLTVGFDLYCRLLEEAIADLKGEKREEEFDPRISAGVDAYLPDEFVPDQWEKLSFYRRLSTARNPEQVGELHQELLDRFGVLPDPAVNLLGIARLRILARHAGLKQVTLKAGEIHLEYREGFEPAAEGLSLLVRDAPWPPRFVTSQETSGTRLEIVFRLRSRIAERRVTEGLEILSMLPRMV
jgi:transcription-repair coupling factor (superfamily II helicase)